MIGFKEKKVGTNLMKKYDTGDQVDGGSIGTSAEREKMRHRGIGDESQARALSADPGLYTRK